MTVDAETLVPGAGVAAQPQLVVRFSLAAADFAALQADAPWDAPAAFMRGRNFAQTGFDTPDFALARQGMALSLAKTRGGFTQTIRAGDVECSALLSHPTPFIASFGPIWAERLETCTAGAELVPIFAIAFRRVTRQAGSVEVRFESGVVAAGGGRDKFYELELRGAPMALYPLALAQADKNALVLQTATLAWRGAMAAGAPWRDAVKAQPPLSGGLSLDEAVVTLTQSCLRQFAANWPVFAYGDAVGAVHQMRVAMRRLRSLLGLFNRAFIAPEFAALRQQAKFIANVMGEARNWDVFVALLAQGPAGEFAEEPGFAGLLAQSAAAREAGYAAVRSLLADPATTRFLLEAEAFLARHGWRNALAVEALTSLAAPAKNFAATSLTRLQHKLRKRGKHIMRANSLQLHQLRIELKKLRYATELFGGLFEARGRVRAYTQAAAQLQEELGLLNDLATARELLARLEQASLDEARAAGIVLGWCAKAASAGAAKLGKRWREFNARKSFLD